MTVFNPLFKYFKVGLKVGIIGCGGLGHLAIQYASKMGAEVTAFSGTPEKSEWLKKLGANFIESSTDLVSLAKQFQQFDIILSTLPTYKPELFKAYLRIVKKQGIFAVVGIPDINENTAPIEFFTLVANEITIVGSIIASVDVIPINITDHKKNAGVLN